MTCPCSRQRFEETAKGRTDVTLHCKSNGDFEALQCDSGVCWCADETTGNLVDGTLAVPDDLWTLLPCCKAALNYCDGSRNFAAAALLLKLN